MSDPADRGAAAPSPVDRPRVPLEIERGLAAAAIAAIGLITFANVVSRYAFNLPLAFTEEYSIALMVVMVFFGASAAFAADKHIRITYFIDRLGARGQARAEVASMLIVALVFLVVAALGGRLVWDEYRFGEMSSGLGHPQWLYTAWMPVIAAVIVLRALGRAWRVLLRGVGTGVHGGELP